MIVSLKFGRFFFFGVRWFWFLIPRRFRGRIEQFFQHRYFNTISKWNFYAFLSTIWALAAYTYFANLEEVPYSFRRRFSYMKMQDLVDLAIEEEQTMLQFSSQLLPETHPLYIEITEIV